MKCFTFIFCRLVYSLLITLGLYEYSRDKIIAFRYFLIIFMANLLSVGILGRYAMIITLFSVTVCMTIFDRKGIVDALFEAISSITMVLMVMLFLSGLGTLMLPGSVRTIVYDVIIGVLFVAVFIFIMPLRRRYVAIKPSKKIKIFSSIALSLFIFLHGAIIPSIAGLASIDVIAVVGLVNTLIIVCAHYSFVYLSSTENEKRLHESELKATSDVLKKALIDSHYSVGLAKSIALYLDSDDLGGLKEYFYTKVEPFMNTELRKIDTLKNLSLSDDLIRNLIYLTKKRAENGHIPMDIEVRGRITDINMDTLHLFKVLNIYFDNAIEASEKCNQPKISLIIQNNQANISFEISNRFDAPNSEQRTLLYRGNGLTFADDYISRYHNVTKHTHVIDNLFTQKLIIGECERWAR